MTTIYPIFGGGIADLAEVGGKARSLMTMAGNNLPVPPGIILSVQFFQPWLDRLHDCEDWQALPRSDNQGLARSAAVLKERAASFRFTPEQQSELETFLNNSREPDSALYAVRSSSPEEDLVKASFAGVYETVLGVRRGGIEDAVRTVFLSALDERAFLYKRQHGFDITSVRIAIVIQRQIASDVAGVGFSLNPLSNCYDEAVINANWGLGESIVSGAASPDRFVVDKVTGKILERHCGGKEVSFFLLGDGGTETRSVPRTTELTLTDGQVGSLSDLIKKVEAAYHLPVDIEWALSGGTLYLLQARPITTFLPLPEKLRTAPGEPRRLYLDLTLVEQGVQRALSPMGAEWFGEVSAMMLEKMTGRDAGHDAAGGFGGTAGGRVYLNISTMFFLMDQKAVAEEFEGLDAAAAEVLRSLGPGAYRLPEKPAFLHGILAAGLYRSAGTILKTVEGMILPDRFDRRFLEGTETYKKALDRIDTEDLDLREYYFRLTALAVDLMLTVTIPTLIDAEMAKSSLKQMFAGEPEEIRKRADTLDRALPHNVTTEMGLAIAGLARIFPPGAYDNIPALALRVAANDFPDGGKADWDRFMDRFGFRGPLEIDLASPRFCEDPALLLSQMRTFASIPEEMDPERAFARQKSEREAAAEFLQEYLEEKSRIRAMEFRKLYQILTMFGGYRESHKYYLVLASYRIRQRICAAGKRLAAEGRLAASGDVFFLTIDDLASGLGNPSVDLASRVDENKRGFAPFAEVSVFPALIDSRGTILRPPRPKDKPGMFFGDAVSAGIVRGPVKVLKSPGEKPVNPGDILVIHAADPGWTPLFIAAGGIVLEVGGMLQHGAIIAREYGKPCIAGIEGVLEKFTDGRMVEVDGASGSVRFLD